MSLKTAPLCFHTCKPRYARSTTHAVTAPFREASMRSPKPMRRRVRPSREPCQLAAAVEQTNSEEDTFCEPARFLCHAFLTRDSFYLIFLPLYNDVKLLQKYGILVWLVHMSHEGVNLNVIPVRKLRDWQGLFF